MKKFNNNVFRTLYEKSSNKNPKTFTKFSETTFRTLNNTGNGIYYSPQSYTGTSNKKEFLAKINTLFADLDVAKSNDGQTQEDIEKKKEKLLVALQALPYPPSAVVGTRNGLQPYWYVSVDDIAFETIARCEKVIKGISQWAITFGSLGDPVHDIVHLLRFPGFNHHKKEPYMVRVVSDNDTTYTLPDLEKAFPYVEKVQSINTELTQSHTGNDLIEQVNHLDIRDVAIRAWAEKGYEASFDKDNRLVVNGKITATFANRDGRNFIATSSSEYPADGNAVTYVAETLNVSNREAFKWIVYTFQLMPTKSKKRSFKPLSQTTENLNKTLEDISPQTPKRSLPLVLDPLLKRIAFEMSPADAESFVNLNIKEYFKLTGAQVSGFAKKVRELSPDPKKRKEEQSQAERLLDFIKNEEAEFFVDEVRDPFARVPEGDHFEVLHVKGKAFRLWAIGLYYKNTNGDAINTDAYQTARGVIENKCIFEGKQYAIHPRVAYEDGVLWYDLGDSAWRAIRVNENGWSIVNTPPILFRRYSSTQVQVEPKGTLKLEEIFDFVNVESEDMKLLLMVWIVSCFIKGFPHASPIIHGQQGSAKTTASEILKAIIDPSVMKTARLPHDPKEAVQMLAHSWLSIFDNVSPKNFSCTMSDLFCTVITGGGVSKRELYSDDEDIIYNLQRVIGMNGIVIVADRPDLLDRSILIELARIPKEKRRSTKKVWSEFEEKLPAILGGIFDTLVRAMQIKKTLTFDTLPRMADFAEWGSAIAIALGYTQERFLESYSRNIQQQSDTVISDSLVATLVLGLRDKMGEKEWEGSATELLEELGKDDIGDVDEKLRKRADFPKAHNALSRTLNELRTTLADAGCYVWQTGTSRKKWHVSKTPEQNRQNNFLPNNMMVGEHPTHTNTAQNTTAYSETTTQLSDIETSTQTRDIRDGMDMQDIPRDFSGDEETYTDFYEALEPAGTDDDDF